MQCQVPGKFPYFLLPCCASGPSTVVKKQPTQQGEDWFLVPQRSKPRLKLQRCLLTLSTYVRSWFRDKILCKELSTLPTHLIACTNTWHGGTVDLFERKARGSASHVIAFRGIHQNLQNHDFLSECDVYRLSRFNLLEDHRKTFKNISSRPQLSSNETQGAPSASTVSTKRFLRQSSCESDLRLRTLNTVKSGFE